MNIFKKYFISALVFMSVAVSFLGFTRTVFAYQENFSIFENITAIRFVEGNIIIPNETQYFPGNPLQISGHINTDNNIVSIGSTPVSMTAKMYSVNNGGVESRCWNRRDRRPI